MFDTWERFKDFMGRLWTVAPQPRQLQRARPQVEALEERWCPAGLWEWTGTGGNSNWSNSGNWLIYGTDDNGQAAFVPSQGIQYPGAIAAAGQNGGSPLAASLNDDVLFNAAGVGNKTAILDVAINPLHSLQFINGWGGTLTANNNIMVGGAGNANSTFLLTEGARHGLQLTWRCFTLTDGNAPFLLTQLVKGYKDGSPAEAESAGRRSAPVCRGRRQKPR